MSFVEASGSLLASGSPCAEEHGESKPERPRAGECRLRQEDGDQCQRAGGGGTPEVGLKCVGPKR